MCHDKGPWVHHWQLVPPVSSMPVDFACCPVDCETCADCVASSRMWQPASNLSICLVDWRDRDSDCGVKNQLLVDGLGLAVRIGQWRARGTHRTGEESTFDSSVAQRSPVANTPVGVQLSDPTVIDVLLVLLAVPTEKGNSQVATVGTVASATCIDSEIHTANHTCPQLHSQRSFRCRDHQKSVVRCCWCCCCYCYCHRCCYWSCSFFACLHTQPISLTF